MSNAPFQPGCTPPTPDAAFRYVGDPIDVTNGANVDRALDFRLWGKIPIYSFRYYDSSRNQARLSLGWGHGHEFAKALVMGVDGLMYRDPLGVQHTLGALLSDGEELTAGPWRVRRMDLRTYRVFERGQYPRDFEFMQGFDHPARIRRYWHGLSEVSFRYTAAGALSSIIDSMSRQIDVEETSAGLLTRMTLRSAGGQKRTLAAYEYDSAGNLARAIDSYGGECRFAYDDANRQVRRVDRNGFTVAFRYDAQGRCISAGGEDGTLAVTLRYDPAVGITRVRRSDGAESQHFYDPASGAVSMIVEPLGGVRKYVSELGRPSKEIDPLGNATEILTDAGGSPVAKRLPGGRVIPIPEPPGASSPPHHREPMNAAEFEHGRLLDWRHSAPPLAGGEHQLDLPLSVRRVIVTRDINDRAWAMLADAPEPLSPPWFPLPEFGRVFDDFGKLVQQHGPGGSLRRWLYDGNGNIRRYVDFDGGEHTFEFESFNHLKRWTRPGGLESRFEWSPYEKITRFTDPGGTTTEFAYDALDRATEVRRNGVVKERYRRDLAGNLVERQDGEGRTRLKIEIGPGNLPVRKELASGGVHEYAYDDEGRYTSIVANGVKTEFKYDAYGDLAADLRAGVGVQHAPFAPQKPGWTKVLGKFTTTYGYRRDGEMRIVDPTGGVHRVRPLGNSIVQRVFANGSREVSQFDACGRCILKAVFREEYEAVPWTRVFTYSGEGHLLRTDDSNNGVTRYKYDAAHRLCAMFRPGDVEGTPFAYDAAGNLLMQPRLAEAVIAPGNRLVSANGDTFEFNDRHHVSRRRGRFNQAFEYDSRDRLVRCTSDRGEWSAEYDALGRRTRVTENGAVTTYYWDDDRLAAEKAPDGRVRIYVYEYPLAMTPMLFVDYDSAEAEADSGRVYTVFADQIGAPIRVLDDQGATVWSARLDPYGFAAVNPESTIEFSFRMPGHWFDRHTGLHYNRFRYYSPELGRYLQSDPMGLAGGQNLYAYPASPLSRVDVRGMNCPQCEEEAAKLKDSPDEEGAPRCVEKGDAEARAKMAEKVGMQDKDLANLQERSEKRGEIIIIRTTNKESLQHHDKPGHSPKPVDCKLKTQSSKKHPDGKREDDGLVTEAAQNWKDPEVQKNFQELRAKGYDFDDNGVLRGPPNGTGDKFYGDHDLQSAWQTTDDPKTNLQIQTNDPAYRDELNKEVFNGRDMVKHGANDEYVDDKGKPLRQPGHDEDFLVIENGTAKRVGPPLSELRKYYDDHGLEWPYGETPHTTGEGE